MKFTLSWLKEHLETNATAAQVVEAMTMAGLEVEHVEDPAAKLAPFTVARIVEAVQHPNADRPGAGPGVGDRLRGHPQPARLAGCGRHRPRPRRRGPRHAEGPRGPAGEGVLLLSRRRSHRRVRSLPGVRRPHDPRREERPL